MIVCGLLILLTGILDALFNLLPSWSWTLGDLPNTGTNVTAWDQNEVATSSVSALSGPWSVMARTNAFLPVDHLVYAFQFLTVLFVALLAFRAAKWIINIIRGAGA